MVYIFHVSNCWVLIGVYESWPNWLVLSWFILPPREDFFGNMWKHVWPQCDEGMLLARGQGCCNHLKSFLVQNVSNAEVKNDVLTISTPLSYQTTSMSLTLPQSVILYCHEICPFVKSTTIILILSDIKKKNNSNRTSSCNNKHMLTCWCTL